MKVKTKEVVIDNWTIVTNDTNRILTDGEGYVSIIGGSDYEHALLLMLKDDEIKILDPAWNAKMSFSSKKILTVIYEVEETE